MTGIQPTVAGEGLPPDTIWEEKLSWFDALPRPVSMFGLLVLFLGTWQLVTGLGLVSPIILPSPWRTAQDLLFVGQGLMSGNSMFAAFWVPLGGRARLPHRSRHRRRPRHSRWRDNFRRARRHALHRGNRHHAEARLRAAFRRLDGVRHFIKSCACGFHIDLSRGRRNSRGSSCGRSQRPDAVQRASAPAGGRH